MSILNLQGLSEVTVLFSDRADPVVVVLSVGVDAAALATATDRREAGHSTNVPVAVRAALTRQRTATVALNTMPRIAYYQQYFKNILKLS